MAADAAAAVGVGELVLHDMAGNHFHVPPNYTDLEPIGLGGFGLVCAATDTVTGNRVAIKKLIKPFAGAIEAKRTYRELLLLQHLHHDNILNLEDVYTTPTHDVYLVTPKMDCDLHKVLESNILQSQHIQFFLYQILRAIKYIHSAHVIHRDLKPSNVLVNESSDLKICDFGMARVHQSGSEGTNTMYVTTRWYRAPEVLMVGDYSYGIDMWSVGCIFGELLTGAPLFAGANYVIQIGLFTELLGTPLPELLAAMGVNEETRTFVASLPVQAPQRLEDRFPEADPDALDLLARMLCWDPHQRISAAQALEHPYMAAYHYPDDEPTALIPLDSVLDEGNDWPAETWRDMTLAAIAAIHQARASARGVAP